MLGEAKHLNFPSELEKQSEILRFAQNDIGRLVVILVRLFKGKECQSARNTCTPI
jgi:hypothetical protein